MRRALVIGASGQVGRHAAAALRARGWDVAGTYATHPAPGLRRLDVLDDAAVDACLREVAPAVCVLSSAMTNVERCEAEPEAAEASNARAPGVVAAASRRAGARVLFLSTEYVFDGTAGPYREEDPTSPVSVYGRTKLEGERRVLAGDPANLAVRTTVVFSHDPAGMNFAMQLLSRLGKGERMRVPSDQLSSPTYAPDLGEALAELCEPGAPARLARFASPQLLNVAGPEVLDRHAFAVRAARALGLDPALLDAVGTASLGQRARRPLRAGLRIDRLRALGLSVRPLDEALADVRARLEAGPPRLQRT
jgi:dTDP-4-dehydrorhamnose reductase